jgi:hypothetical protein
MCFDSIGDIIHISLYCWSILFNIFSTQQEILQNSSIFEKKLDIKEALKKRQFFNRRNLIALFPFMIIDLDHLHTILMNEWNKLKTQNNLVEDKEEFNKIMDKIKDLAQLIIGIDLNEYRQKVLTGKYLDRINEMEGIELNYIRNLIQSGNDEQISQYLEKSVSDLIKTVKKHKFFNSKCKFDLFFIYFRKNWSYKIAWLLWMEER